MAEIVKIGRLVFWAKEPLALWMKPRDAPRLWKVGMYMEHKDDYYCIIMDKDGKLQQCPHSMIKTYTVQAS